MNKTKFAVLAPLAMALLLTGCDNAKQSITAMSVALDKEYIQPSVPVVVEANSFVLMDGKRIRIKGVDDCLKEPRGIVMEMMFGPDNSPKDGCVLLKPDTASVEITYFPSGEPITEIWTVERPHESTFALRRPNGEYIKFLRVEATL